MRAELEEEHGNGVNVFERSGVSLLIRHGGGKRRPLHRWSDQDRDRIHHIEHRATLLAGTAGAVSGGLIGGFELLLRDQLGGDEFSDWLQNWRWTLLFFAIAAVISAIEIGWIYWMMLREAARIGAVAGLELEPRDMKKIVALGMTRAGLEMPNPRVPIYGIDPYARIARWKLLGWTVLYRLKVGATSFVLRIVLRRLLARAAIRTAIPLIAVPVFAIWNAVVTGWVMRELRIRAAGPQAVEDMGERIGARMCEVSEDTRRCVLMTIIESMQRAQDAHPNFVLAIDRMLGDSGMDPQSLDPDWQHCRGRLEALAAEDRELLLDAAVCMAVMNGRTRQAQRDLLIELHRDGARGLDFDALDDLRRNMIEGRGLPAGEVRRVWRR